LTALLGLGARPAFAQSTDKNPLALIKSFKCLFPVYAVEPGKPAEPQAQIKQADQFTLTIDDIDTDSGSGRVTGTAGPVEVTALLTVSSLHFMERSVTEPSTSRPFSCRTAASGSSGPSTAARLPADEHPGFTSEPTVTQNYGTCEAGRVNPLLSSWRSKSAHTWALPSRLDQWARAAGGSCRSLAACARGANAFAIS
jgi:hypothetical protein